MGFLSDILDPFGIWDGLTGDSDAPGNAAAAQEKLGREAIAETRAAREQARQDLQPFASAGRDVLPGLTDLVTNPQAQAAYVTQNPFYGAMADDAQRRLLNNQAARGKVGSGETAKALQNSLLLLGNDLVNQGIGQRQNLATLGQNAAAGQASTTVNTGAGIANTLTGIGNAQAAGIIGAQNQKAAGMQNLVGTGLGIAQLALSDARAKENVVPVGETYGGTPLYRYNYKGDDGVHIGVLAQQVERQNPDAVVTIDGLKHVDYERVS